MTISKSGLPHFDDYFAGKTYPDEFGIHTEWNAHFNELWKNRVIRQKERDAFLAELYALHLIHSVHHQEIVEMEPTRVGTRALEFSFIDDSGSLWHAEVKHPAWDGEVERDISMSRQDKFARKAKPQFISGEGHWISPADAFSDSIKNAVPKFLKGDKNLLIVVPNMFGSVGWIPYVENTVMEELRSEDPEELISAVIILEPRMMAEKAVVDYEPYKIVEISEIPTWE
jgi:hypothetical protein